MTKDEVARMIEKHTDLEFNEKYVHESENMCHAFRKYVNMFVSIVDIVDDNALLKIYWEERNFHTDEDTNKILDKLSDFYENMDRENIIKYLGNRLPEEYNYVRFFIINKDNLVEQFTTIINDIKNHKEYNDKVKWPRCIFTLPDDLDISEISYFLY